MNNLHKIAVGTSLFLLLIAAAGCQTKKSPPEGAFPETVGRFSRDWVESLEGFLSTRAPGATDAWDSMYTPSVSHQVRIYSSPESAEQSLNAETQEYVSKSQYRIVEQGILTNESGRQGKRVFMVSKDGQVGIVLRVNGTRGIYVYARDDPKLAVEFERGLSY